MASSPAKRNWLPADLAERLDKTALGMAWNAASVEACRSKLENVDIAITEGATVQSWPMIRILHGDRRTRVCERESDS